VILILIFFWKNLKVATNETTSLALNNMYLDSALKL